MVVGAAAASERHYVMRRWLFNIAASLSLALCLATATLWVRSHWVTDDVLYTRPNQWAIGLGTKQGQVTFCVIESRAPGGFRGGKDGFRYTNRTSWVGSRSFLPGVVKTIDVAGFERSELLGPARMRWWTTPLWSVALLTVVAPAVWSWRWHRRRVRGRGKLCSSCGYDLRATPDRCPECGAVPDGAAGAAA